MEAARDRELNMIKVLMEQGKKIPKIIIMQDADGRDVEYEICAEDEEGEEEKDSQDLNLRRSESNTNRFR